MPSAACQFLRFGALLLACCAGHSGHALAGQSRESGKPSSAQVAATLQSAQTLLRQHQYAKAMDAFEAVLAANPDSTADPESAAARQGERATAIAWAASEAQANHADGSMQILTRGLQHTPRDPQLLLSFGLQALALGQLPVAEQALHAAAELRPRDPETTYALARLELEQQHLPDAERDLKAYLAVRPGDASAYFGLGHVYAMEQRTEDARTALEMSIKLQPRQTASYYELGQMDLNEGQDASASANFQQVLQRDPRHAGALTGMGQLELRARHYPQAESYLARAEVSDPAYAPPHYYRGLALARLGRTEEAKQELQRGDSRPHATPETVQPDQQPPQ